jgi:hypothetical protein
MNDVPLEKVLMHEPIGVQKDLRRTYAQAESHYGTIEAAFAGIRETPWLGKEHSKVEGLHLCVSIDSQRHLNRGQEIAFEDLDLLDDYGLRMPSDLIGRPVEIYMRNKQIIAVSKPRVREL